MEKMHYFGIALAVIIIGVAIYLFKFKENYATGNDLAWAAGLTGNCSSCTMRNTDFSNPNLLTDTLQSSLQSGGPRDFYGYPVKPLYQGEALQNELFPKIWY